MAEAMKASRDSASRRRVTRKSYTEVDDDVEMVVDQEERSIEGEEEEEEEEEEEGQVASTSRRTTGKSRKKAEAEPLMDDIYGDDDEEVVVIGAKKKKRGRKKKDKANQPTLDNFDFLDDKPQKPVKSIPINQGTLEAAAAAAAAAPAPAKTPRSTRKGGLKSGSGASPSAPKVSSTNLNLHARVTSIIRDLRANPYKLPWVPVEQPATGVGCDDSQPVLRCEGSTCPR
jgi:hypothetical protein